MFSKDYLEKFKGFEKEIQMKFLDPVNIPKQYQKRAYCNYLPFQLNLKRAKNINKDMIYASASESDKSKKKTDKDKPDIVLGQHKQISFYESYAREIIFQLFKYPIMSFHNYEHTITYLKKLKHNKWIYSHDFDFFQKNKGCEREKGKENKEDNPNCELSSININNKTNIINNSDNSSIKEIRKKGKKNNCVVSFRLSSEEEGKKSDNKLSNVESSDMGVSDTDSKYLSSKEENKIFMNKMNNKNKKKSGNISCFETFPSSIDKNNNISENSDKNNNKPKIINNAGNNSKYKKVKRSESLLNKLTEKLCEPHLKKYYNSEKEDYFLKAIKTETIRGDHDFLIHSLDGNVLEEVLKNKEIAPFIFYGNFTVDKSKKYDIIGEIKETSKGYQPVIEQFEKYEHIISYLKKSDELNNKLFFKKKNKKIIMYVFNGNYHYFIKDILDFKINQDKFKEMEYYKSSLYFQKIVKSFVQEQKERNNGLIKNIIESGIPFVIVFVQHLMKLHSIKDNLNCDLNEKVKALDNEINDLKIENENTQQRISNLEKILCEHLKKIEKLTKTILNQDEEIKKIKGNDKDEKRNNIDSENNQI